ncbi:unnamed protein product [Rotaria sordida]|uniref:G domain-containing protein n=1 Tax=Rotaria sordida TaxID=392033 RepID=A0A819TII6_9BILA|nr:unnamed protein product [Rotaria sordida]
MLRQSIQRTQDTSQLTIKRTAIDSYGRLGSLYDGCQDQLLGILDITFERSLIQLYDKTQCILEKGEKNYKRNLLELINIDEQLRLSLLLNLTSKSGIATIIDYPYIINEYTRILHYSYIHQEERFPDEIEKIRERLESCLIKTNATHIITGISWGIDIVIILQLPSDDNIVSMIDIVLEKYRAYLNGDCNDFKLTRDDVNSYKHIIDTKVYSNIPAITEMTTLHNIFHSISHLKTDNTQYQQLYYILYPISNSSYKYLDSIKNIRFEQYLYELSTSMKIIEIYFNKDILNLLCGHFKERFSNAYKQWLNLKNEYINLIERLSKLVIEIRCGQKHTSTLDRILNHAAQIILKNNIFDLCEDLTDLYNKGYLITNLNHQNIQYCNVIERKIDKNDNEDTLKHKLIIDEHIDRILCSNDLLNKNNPIKFKKLCNNLIDEFKNNIKLHLIYADFSYCTYELHDMIILSSIKNDNKQKNKLIYKEISSFIDNNNNNNTSTSPRTRTHIYIPSPSSKLSITETINILLLGETGVGKSTFINALVNYLTFKTFDKAQSEKPIVAIPVSFSITTDDNLQEYKVKLDDLNKSTNENFQYHGQTITQYCQSHIYYLHNNDGTKLRIIDTPGFGDIRGIEQDNLNMQHIIRYIKNFNYLNAICIFVKSNESRLNIFFRSCFIQLFNLLDSNIRHNIIFCFTNSRSTFYTSGHIGLLLKKMLTSLSIGDVPFKKENTFCFDNESFRYLVALQNKIQFNDYEKQEYKKSWSNSVHEINRFIRYIRKKLIPYYIPNEFESIRSAEIEIVQIIHPILETIRNILRKIIRSKMNQLKVTFESDLNDNHSYKIENNIYHSNQHYPHQPIRIDFLEDYKILKNSLSQIQDNMIEQLTLLCHVNVEFAYFLLNIAHYSQNDPFLNGFIRMIDEENIICENRNRNYMNLQLVEGLKKLANNYQQRIEIIKTKLEQNILSDIYQWIKYMHEYPLISEYVIDSPRENLTNDNKITSI